MSDPGTWLGLRFPGYGLPASSMRTNEAEMWQHAVAQMIATGAAVQSAVDRMVEMNAARLDSLISETKRLPGTAPSAGFTWTAQTSGVIVVTGIRVVLTATSSAGILTLGERTFALSAGVNEITPTQLVTYRQDRAISWTSGTPADTTEIDIWGYAAPALTGGKVR